MVDNSRSESLAATDDTLFAGKLRLRQRPTGHRAGTDAVLLAAAAPPGSGWFADLGAATGVVGLRLAQLNPDARVMLVERDAALAGLARDNAAANGLSARVTVRAGDVLELSQCAQLREAFACIATNPPYFARGTGRVSPDPDRAAAHVIDGTLADWLRNAAAILAPAGYLVMIHRADALDAVLAALARRFGDVRIRFVHPDAGSPAIRLLVLARKGSRAPLRVLPPVIVNENGSFTGEAAALHAGIARIDMRAF